MGGEVLSSPAIGTNSTVYRQQLQESLIAYTVAIHCFTDTVVCADSFFVPMAIISQPYVRILLAKCLVFLALLPRTSNCQ